MRQIVRFNKVIKEIIITGDFLVLNTVLALVCIGCENRIFTSLNSDSYIKIIIFFNFCYLISIHYISPIVQNRLVRAENIIARVLETTTLHFILCAIILGYIHIGRGKFTFLLIFYLCFTVASIGYKFGLRYLIKNYRRHGGNSRSVVYIGTNDNIAELYRQMSGDPTSGFRVKGYFDDSPSPLLPDRVPYLGGIDKAMDTFLQQGVEQVYCCLPASREKEILPIIDFCENHLIRFYSVPDVHNYLKRAMHVEVLGEIPILYIREEPLMQLENRILKRGFDLLFSLCFLCLLFPLVYIIVGCVIKITSPGPVFFKQKRSGQDGKEFWCYKFRSMKVNKDADTVQATRNDPRTTKFGNFLRRSSIDELPQFFNVLIGNMSIVGPRPHMLKHTEEYSRLINKYMVRHFVKPGITGWAQVNGFRGETRTLDQMEGRVHRDIWYIENWTFWLDIRIIWLTVKNGIRGEKKAY